MAARRGKSQARRNDGNGLPGWAWMILGIVIALVAVLVVPRYLKSGGNDGFFRPQPNAAAQPAVSAVDEFEAPPPEERPRRRPATPAPAAAPAAPEYDFYTVLPEQEVALTDAELAASAREEAERQRRTLAAQRQREQQAAAERAAATTAATTTTTAPVATAATPATAAAADGTRYILQAGSFSASGDAEALKARIALLGLSARVESGSANGRTVYRVRMGPYGTATELAEAKQKLGNGGLPAMAIRAN